MKVTRTEAAAIVTSIFERKQELFLKQAMINLNGLRKVSGQDYRQIGQHAEDVVMESFMSLYHAILNNDVPAHLEYEQYLFGIIRNNCFDKYRSIRSKINLKTDLKRSEGGLEYLRTSRYEKQGFFGKIYKRIDKEIKGKNPAINGRYSLLDSMVDERTGLEIDQTSSLDAHYEDEVGSECLRIVTELAAGLDSKYHEILLLKIITDGAYGDEDYPSSNIADARDRLAKRIADALYINLHLDNYLDQKRGWLHLLDILQEAQVFPEHDTSLGGKISRRLDINDEIVSRLDRQELVKRRDLFTPVFNLVGKHRAANTLIKSILDSELEESTKSAVNLKDKHYEQDILDKIKCMIETHCCAAFYNIKYLSKHGK